MDNCRGLGSDGNESSLDNRCLLREREEWGLSRLVDGSTPSDRDSCFGVTTFVFLRSFVREEGVTSPT